MLHVCPFPHCAGSQVFSAVPSPSDCPPPRRASPMLGGPLFNLLLFFEVQLSPFRFNPPSEFPSISHPLHSLLTSPLFSAPSSHPTHPPTLLFLRSYHLIDCLLMPPFLPPLSSLNPSYPPSSLTLLLQLPSLLPACVAMHHHDRLTRC